MTINVPVTNREAARIRAVEACAVLDPPHEARFDRLVFTTARLFRVPMAMLSIVEKDRVWVKAGVGPLPREWPRHLTFCNTTIELDETLVVENATFDVRFSRLPNVVGPPNIRFYAGTLCILDAQPRAFLERARLQLARLARDEENLIQVRTTG